MIALIKKLYANDVIRYIFFRRLHHSCKFSQLFLSAPGRPAKRNCQCDFRYSGNCVCLCGKLQICFSGQMRNLEGPHPAFLQVRRSQTEHHGHRGWRSMVFRRDRTFK